MTSTEGVSLREEVGSVPRALRRTRSTWAVLPCLALALAACSSTPDPTVAQVTVSASEDVNPDPTGEASPVFVRLYELTSDTTFTTATFSQLYNDEKATLGDALRGREEVSLAPGQTATVSREFQDGSKYLGVLAAYQDIDAATWRATAPVPQNETTAFEVKVGRSQVSVAPAGQ